MVNKDGMGNILFGDKVDPYRALASAVVLQAVKDYRNRRMSADQLRRFCHSPWYQMLTNIDGDYILEEVIKDDGEGNKAEN